MRETGIDEEDMIEKKKKEMAKLMNIYAPKDDFKSINSSFR